MFWVLVMLIKVRKCSSITLACIPTIHSVNKISIASKMLIMIIKWICASIQTLLILFRTKGIILPSSVPVGQFSASPTEI